MAIRAFINRLWVNPRAYKPFQYTGEYRTPAPGSQKPREFTLEAADKSEYVGSIYYYPRGAARKTQPKAELVLDPKEQTVISPKAAREAHRRMEFEQANKEAVAAGKKPAAAIPTTPLTPIVEWKTIEIEFPKGNEWMTNMELQMPPGNRKWAKHAVWRENYYDLATKPGNLV